MQNRKPDTIRKRKVGDDYMMEVRMYDPPLKKGMVTGIKAEVYIVDKHGNETSIKDGEGKPIDGLVFMAKLDTKQINELAGKFKSGEIEIYG